MRRSPPAGRSTGTRSKVPPEVREQVERRSGRKCEAAVNANCATTGHFLHHILPRSAGGKHTVANLLQICTACHEYIHAHPEESYRRGWLKRRS
jgi:5-methylcytosine-specific restriction endonuclease McrA